MGSASIKTYKSFFLFTALIVSIAGCGSGGSTAHNDTGSIAAKLTWSSSGAKTAAKTLYAAPAGVTNIRVSVYSDASLATLIARNEFTAIPGENGSGTIDGIPAGNGRAVKVEGLGIHSGFPGLNGVLIYLGTATVDVIAGPTPTPVNITMEAPKTSVSPTTTASNAGFEVTLTTSVPATIIYTTNEPATIYYTTNGTNPTTSSASGISPVKISVVPPMTLNYFAGVRGLYESIQSIFYDLVP